MNLFNFIIRDIGQKIDKKSNVERTKEERKKMEILQLLLILGSILGHSGVHGVNLKNTEFCTNTNCAKVNLHELNSMGNTLKVKAGEKSERELAQASDAASSSEQRKGANESSGLDQRKTNKQTIKQIALVVKAQSQTRATVREVDNNTARNNELIEAANQPPMKNLLLNKSN